MNDPICSPSEISFAVRLCSLTRETDAVWVTLLRVERTIAAAQAEPYSGLPPNPRAGRLRVVRSSVDYGGCEGESPGWMRGEIAAFVELKFAGARPDAGVFAAGGNLRRRGRLSGRLLV